MDIAPVEIRYYQTISEKRPFQEWLDSLESTLQQIVSVRLARIRRCGAGGRSGNRRTSSEPKASGKIICGGREDETSD